MADLHKVREWIFESDNRACFIERERILNRLSEEMRDYQGEDKYALILARVLTEVSTPIFGCDYFAGRVVEALPDEGMTAPNTLLCSTGHMSFDYEKILRVGLSGILKDIQENAKKTGTSAAKSFARNAGIVIMAIRDFADRYAREAEKKGYGEMAEALKHVPFEPAYDFFSALQGMWILHMIAGCYVGSRDYAFGRFDQYMLPFYQKALEMGKTKAELTELLAGFLIKTNEICGRHTWNYQAKPVLCQASKQYVNIGGEAPNEFSGVVLDAAKMSNMAQPQIVVLLKPDANEAFTAQVFEALAYLTDKMNIYNYDSISKALMAKGIPEEIAKDFTYSACCTMDLNYRSFRQEYFVPVPLIFRKALVSRDYDSLQEVIDAFQVLLREDMQNHVDEVQKGFSEEECRRSFVLDSLFLTDSALECRYACDGQSKYHVLNMFCPGVATIGDSLMVLDKLVFREKRYTYAEFRRILEEDYKDQEVLRNEILNYTKFGNDTEADNYVTMAGKAFLDVADALVTKENHYIAPGFYSLERENSWSQLLGATPDGRKAGDPFSENQSPTYGADKNGITALLKSLVKLPFDRTVTGGLNLTFAQKVTPEILQSLIISYFQMGGFHVGISVIDRDTLTDAMANPDKYKSLTVRLYGFSEYFTSLPKWQQIAVLNRTEYR